MVAERSVKPAYTNELGLSDILARSIIKSQTYDAASRDYSATSLYRCPRQVQLGKRYGSSVAKDVADLWPSFRGNAVHAMIEDTFKDDDRYLVEYNISFVKNGKRISTTLDLYDKETYTIYDHKTTTVAIHGMPLKKDWIKQLNLYALFLEYQGYRVDRLIINCIYLDWRPNSGRYKDDKYPQLPAVELEIPLWPKEEREQYFQDMLDAQMAAETLPDNELPYCSSEDMWEKDKVIAVYRPGATRATKLCYTEDQAKRYIKDNNLVGCKIEVRRPERTRCERFCDVSSHCNQYKEWVKQYEIPTKN